MTGAAGSALPVPARMQGLRRDKHDRPVPWFVAVIDGVPDFRVVDTARMVEAHRFGKCMVCAQPLGRYKAFLLGPMCTVSRTTAEPPSHRECVTYSARACPFMSRPTMPRRETGLPEDGHTPGMPILRNPGASAVWITRGYKPFRVPQQFGGGVLFTVGDPESVTWWARGRHATRAEVLESMTSGIHALQESATAEGPDAEAALQRQYDEAMRWLAAA